MTKSLGLAEFLKTSGFLMMARVGGTGLGFLIQLGLVRVMTPTNYGVFVVALSLAAVLSILCACGFPSVTARFIASYQRQDDKARIAGFLSSGMLHIAVTSGLVGFLVAGLVWSGLVDGNYHVPLVLACLTAPVLAVTRFSGALSNIARRFYLTYLPDVTFRPLVLAGSLLIAYFISVPMTSANVLLIHVGAALAACCLIWVLLRPRRQFGVEQVEPVTDIATWRRAATPMIFVTLLTSFLADIDILILSVLLPAEEVGIFSVCLRIMLLIEFGIQTVFQMSTPDLAEAKANDEPVLMKLAIRRAQHVMCLFTLAALVGVAVMGEWVLLLFGERFTVGADALVLLVAGQALRSLFGPATQVLTVVGAQMRSLASYGIALVVLIVGNVLIVPGLGIEGAAAVLSGSMVLGSLLQAHAVSQKTGVSVLSTLFSTPTAQEKLASSQR